MFEFIGRLLGTSKGAEAVVTSVSQGLDKLVYTSEEKADNAAKERAAAREMIIRWHEATSGSHLARRVIALSIVGVYLSCYVLAMILLSIVPWVEVETAKALSESAKVFKELGNEMYMPTTLVLAFYFTVAASGKVMDKILESKKVRSQ